MNINMWFRPEKVVYVKTVFYRYIVIGFENTSCVLEIDVLDGMDNLETEKVKQEQIEVYKKIVAEVRKCQ